MSDNPAYTHLWTPPAPPGPLRHVVARLWDSRHAEDWIRNGTHPHDRPARGDYLTATGTDHQGGRWARLEDEVLRAQHSRWLRHITEVSVIASIWWRTVWQRWPKRPNVESPATDIRIALAAGDLPMPMFHLYARLGADNLPATGPTLMTFAAGADPGTPTDATVEIPVNADVDELLEWLLWLPFDGRRQLQP